MAGNIKGITIEIDGDTTKLSKALQSAEKSTKDVNSELRQVNNLLKFNPGNADLIAQKQELLAKQVQNTSAKLKTLKDAQAQVEEQFKSGDLGEDEYRAFQREVIATEGKLKNYQSQAKATATEQKELESNTKQLSSYFEASGKSVDDFSDILGPKLSGAIKEGKASASQLNDAINKIGRTVTDSEDNFEGFKNALKNIDDGGSIDQLKNELKGLDDTAQQTQDTLSRGVTAEGLENAAQVAQQAGDAMVDFGKQSLEAFDSVDAGSDIIVTKTGLSGKALDGLNDIYDELTDTMQVNGDVFTMSGEAIAASSQAFGLSGDQAKEASKALMMFADVNETDVASSADLAKEALGAFNMKGQELPGMLDSLQGASQRSHVSVDELAQSAVKAAPVADQLGLSFNDTVNVLGDFSKAGVDGDKAMSLMSKGIATFAKDGKSAQQGFKELSEKMKNAKTDAEKVNIASEVFGTKGAVIMSKGIKDGSINFEDFGKKATDSGGALEKAFKNSKDPIDEFTRAQNQSKKAMAELGGSIADTLAPVLSDIMKVVKQVAEWFGKLPGPVKQAAVVFGILTTAAMILAPIVMILAAANTALNISLIPIIGIVLGVIAVITLIVVAIQNWGKIVDWVKGVFSTIGQFFQDVWNNVKEIFTNTINAIVDWSKQTWQSLIDHVKNIWSSITGFFSNLWNGVKSIFTNVWNAIKEFVSGVVDGMKEKITNIWNAIKTTTSNVFNGVKRTISDIWNGIKTTVSNVVNGVKDKVTNVWNGIKSTTTSVWNGIKRAIETPMNAARNLVKGVIDKIKGFFNFKISWPHIPMPHFSISPAGWNVGQLLKGKIPSLGINWYANGGIMTKPTMFANNGGNVSIGGEAGPEGVIPLNEKTLAAIGKGIADASGDTGGTTINLTVYGELSTATARSWATTISNELERLRGRNGATGGGLV